MSYPTNTKIETIFIMSRLLRFNCFFSYFYESSNLFSSVSGTVKIINKYKLNLIVNFVIKMMENSCGLNYYFDNYYYLFDVN